MYGVAGKVVGAGSVHWNANDKTDEKHLSEMTGAKYQVQPSHNLYIWK